MTQTVKVRKVGDTIVVTIPAAMCRTLKIKPKQRMRWATIRYRSDSNGARHGLLLRHIE